MQKNWKSLCALFLVICMLVGVMPIGALATNGESTQIVGQQLMLGDELTMRFYAKIEPEYIGDAVMTISVDGSTVDTCAINSMTAQADGTYLFSVGLAAAQMSDEIKLVLTSGETELLNNTYSIRNYAGVLLSGNYADTTKALVKEMLNYGAKAQLYFDYNTENLANVGYEIETAAAVPSYDAQVVVNGKLEGISYYGASVLFVSKLAVRYYFNASNGVAERTFKVDGVAYTPVAKDGMYYIEVPNINPQDMATAMEVVVSDGENNLSFTYSPLHYLTRMYYKQTSSESLKNLLQAAFGYFGAAATYAGLVSHTVSFSDGAAPQVVENGCLATAPVVSKDGYYFKGWYNGEEKFDFSTPITSDITLTAKWEEIPADMWNDFSASTTADIFDNGTTVTWLESYEGEDGVLKIEHNSDHKWINTLGNWPAAHSADSYADATALKLRLRLEDNEGGNMLYLFSQAANADGSDLYVKVFEGLVTTNGWVEYTISLNVPAYYNALHNLQLHYWSGDGSTLYIDEITVVRTPMNMWNDFSDSSCASVWHYDNATLSWLESYNGAQGVFKIENSGGRAYVGNTDGINWGAVRDASVYEGATALKFRILLEDDSDGNQLEAWYRGSSNYKMVFTGLTSTDGWTEFTVPFDPATEYDLMDGMYFQYWSGNGGTVYIDEITAVYTCTVSFSDGVEAQTVEVGALATAPAVSKDGYYFKGWYNGEEKFDFSTPITSDITLTAKWEEIPADMWNDFSASTTADIFDNGTTVTWLESYEGEDGVLKIEHNSDHKWINTLGNWPAAHSADSYADATALKLRLRLEDNEGGNMLYLFSQAANADGSDLYVKVFEGLVTTNGWVEYTISLNVPAYYNALHNLQLHYWSGDGSTLYIDEITVVRTPMNMWNDFSDSSCASVWHYDNATLTWLESYNGAQGVFKIENSSGRAYIGNTDGINWGAVRDASAYEDATALKFRILLEDDSDGNQLEAWYRGSSNYKMVFTGLTSTDGWTEFIVPFDPATEYDLMDGMYFQYWSGNGGTVYIDEITVVRTPMNVWNDFSASTTANIDGNGATVTWLESYEGEDGVLKIEHNSDHKWINTLGNWAAARSADSYADATALKLRLRLEDNEGGNMLYLFSKAANADGSDLYVQVFDGVVTTNGWVEYTISLDVSAYYNALHNLQLHYWSGDGSTLYIDEITVA